MIPFATSNTKTKTEGLPEATRTAESVVSKNPSPYMNTSRRTSKKADRLAKGPCSEVYNKLSQCNASNEVGRYLDQLRVCPDESAQLMKCVEENRLYMYSPQPSRFDTPKKK